MKLLLRSKLKNFFKKMFNYSYVQLTAIVIDYFFFIILIFVGVDNYVSFALAKVVSILYSYMLHSKRTFVGTTVSFHGKLIYGFQSIAAPVFSIFLFSYFSFLVTHDLVRKVLIDCVMSLVNFLIMNFIIFKRIR